MTLLTSPVRLLVSILLLSIIVISSCKKEISQTLSDQDERQANVAATESNAEAEDVFNGVFDDALGVNTDVGMGGTGIFSRTTAGNYSSTPLNGRIDNTSLLPACLNITIVHTTTNIFPVTITFDFGSTGCYANDGHWRKGKIIIDYSNRLLVPGAIGSIRFEDFTIDTIGIDNSTSYTITNTGTPDKLQFTVDVNAKLSKPSGNYCEWHSHKVITRTDGNLTPTPLDDVLKIEGNASGKVKRSDLVVAWKADITDPFIKKFTCRWISKGTIKVGRENLSPTSQWLGILDYGSGICDNRATLTINGITLEITLR
jgi:hypothetical protein